MTARPPRVCGDVSRPAAIAHALRRRRQIVVLAELVLSPRVLAVLALVVALAVLGIWRNMDPAACSPGYHESTASLVYTAGPCIDTGNAWYRNEPIRCTPAPGVHPHPAAFSSPSCTENGGTR